MGVIETGKTIQLTTESGASAEVYLFGATVTSWKVDGKDRLYLSTKSTLDSSKPVSPEHPAEIRGGIPIVFPVFGPPPSTPSDYAALAQHGFARTQDWTLSKIVMDRPEGVSIRLVAPPPPAGFKHDYELAYVMTLSKHQLSTDMHIINRGTDDFMFQALLHGYLAVPDVSKIKISGMGTGTEFRDKAAGNVISSWEGGDLVIDKMVDRVYHSVPSQEIHLDDGAGSGLKVRFKGFIDCTIWNPQEAMGSKMADLDDKGWERYVCIEPGYVKEFKTLKGGEEFLGQQILTVI